MCRSNNNSRRRQEYCRLEKQRLRAHPGHRVSKTLQSTARYILPTFGATTYHSVPAKVRGLTHASQALEQWLCGYFRRRPPGSGCGGTSFFAGVLNNSINGASSALAILFRTPIVG